MRDDRNHVILGNPGFEVPRLQAEIGDVGHEDLRKEPDFDPSHLYERVRFVRPLDVQMIFIEYTYYMTPAKPKWELTPD